MLYGIVLGIHTCTLCAALLLFAVNELLLIPARRGQRGPARMAFFASRFAGLLITAGVLAGIVLVFIGGWSLLTPWLVLSFALIAALMAVEHKFVRPWATQAQAALRGAVSAVEVKAIASDKRALAGRMAMITLFALIVALMTTKPELNPFA
ncbi:hypothetical protein FJ872_11955 [Mesorhizobium sp. B2-5-9]|uniref:hypothetical protein n=1 Tax=unclassified Mesorhizobium TaxID=325217 RepID=UPI001126F069|nr:MULTISPECIES: hypothetical protein [unclassified Mesorhizobium]MBZ9725813.1 hypothetical protein [Mesorhizobium sp. CO1-1-11]TPK20068.1 hypothetical protein FJ872_11955 [Mesorhizobium sp. B2-5-9]